MDELIRQTGEAIRLAVSIFPEPKKVSLGVSDYPCCALTVDVTLRGCEPNAAVKAYERFVTEWISVSTAEVRDHVSLTFRVDPILQDGVLGVDPDDFPLF